MSCSAWLQPLGQLVRQGDTPLGQWFFKHPFIDGQRGPIIFDSSDVAVPARTQKGWGRGAGAQHRLTGFGERWLPWATMGYHRFRWRGENTWAKDVLSHAGSESKKSKASSLRYPAFSEGRSWPVLILIDFHFHLCFACWSIFLTAIHTWLWRLDRIM